MPVLESRTTPSHAWKPPPETGTVSEERAERWVGKQAPPPRGGQLQTPPPAAEASRSNQASPSRGGGSRSPSPHGRTTPGRRGSTHSSVNGGRPRLPSGRRRLSTDGSRSNSPTHTERSPADDDVEYANEEEVQEFRATWCEGKSGGEPVKGRLVHYQAEGCARPGMSHPPQSAKVVKELALYLKRYNIAPTPVTKPRRRGSTQGSPNASMMSSDGESDDGSTSQGSESRRASRADGGAFGDLPGTAEGSFGHGRSGRRDRRGQSGAGTFSKTATGNKRTSVLPPGSWKLELQQQNKGPPPPPHEHDVSRWRNDLTRQSRDHGFVLGKRDCYDLSDLAIYHNETTRLGESWGSRSAPDLAAPRVRLLGLKATMRSLDPTAPKPKTKEQKIASLFGHAGLFGGGGGTRERVSIHPNAYASEPAAVEDGVAERSALEDLLAKFPATGDPHGASQRSSVGFGSPSGGGSRWLTGSSQASRRGAGFSPAKLRSMAEAAKTGHVGPMRMQQLARTAGVSVVTGNRLQLRAA